MKNAVFTIVAKNYIGLASVLERSVKEHADVDFFIFVADEFDKEIVTGLSSNILIAKDKLEIDETTWTKMAFQYSLVEFCTAIKPFCFDYFFKSAGYENCIYLDPDIYLFNSLKPVFSDLEKYSIVITPHIISIQTHFCGDYPDYDFLVNGTFNMGFIGLRQSPASLKMLDWWKNRLEDQCFYDNERGMATDQKWMNMLPAYFAAPDLYISKNAGYNLAPWNYHERKIVIENGIFLVTNRIELDEAFKVPLTFVHFSGYDYRAFIRREVSHKAEKQTNFTDTKALFDKYSQALATADFNKYINLPYSYNYFENGIIITALQRRIYRRLAAENTIYKNPFSTLENTFYSVLKKQGLLDHASVSDEKITNKTISGFDKKLGAVNLFFRMIKTLIGVRRYSILARFLKRYLREENQVYLFDKDFKKKLW